MANSPLRLEKAKEDLKKYKEDLAKPNLSQRDRIALENMVSISEEKVRNHEDWFERDKNTLARKKRY